MGQADATSHGTAPSGAVNLTKYAWLSIAAALATIALKTGAWWITGSVGLLSDAAESVVNLVAAVIALVALTVAARPPDAEHHYGHGKAEYFSAAIEGLMIFVAAAVILVTAVQRLFNPVELESLGIGLAISLVATGINGFVGLLLIRVGPPAPLGHAHRRRQAPHDRCLDLGRRRRRRAARGDHRAGCSSTRSSRSPWP